MGIDISPRFTEEHIELSTGFVESLLHLLDGTTLIFDTLHALVDILNEVSVAARIVQPVIDHLVALVSRKVVSAKRQPNSSSCSGENELAQDLSISAGYITFFAVGITIGGRG
jgi:hypothetical protein